MNRIKAIIFDFDGVIAESVNVKTEAFAELFKPYGDHIVDRVVRHHLLNGGVSRFEKFKFYYESFLNTTITEKEVNILSEKFSRLVLDKVVNAPFVIGAYEFISSNYTKYDMYISSGTPEKELKIIVERRKLDTFFVGVFGSPVSKAIHTSNILKTGNYNNSEVVFIGDALTDKEAALDNKINFIARVAESNSPLSNEDLTICDLTKLNEIIRNNLRVSKI
jgi:phosphoglycolate phosphatase-like HAD superfamily hydrolase